MSLDICHDIVKNWSGDTKIHCQIKEGKNSVQIVWVKSNLLKKALRSTNNCLQNIH